ncbi:MAG: DUF2207 domain-containing protein [Alphaproteobacteria bacterium]|nr:DUF2207 domain-containing protein [Alphaproteobacteria bacterium]
MIELYIVLGVAVRLVIILVDALIYHVLEAPTVMGRRVMDQIEGFKRFLSVAERERLEMLNPPDRAPEQVAETLVATAGSGGGGGGGGW